MSKQPESQQGASQSDKFKEAARDLLCDEDEARWDDRLSKVVKQKPQDE